jgi:Pyruvate/2-oxoacid:ferredoxin oxidoreductase delta subunit
MAKKIRDIIEIDEECCNGCGQCVIDCAEGAIALVNGKAKVIADIYCDGLGACLGGCPVDALRIIRREADDFNEGAVREHLLRQGKPEPMAAHAEPGAAAGVTLLPMRDGPGSAAPDACEAMPDPGVAGGSGARRWPLKIRLIHEEASFLRGAALLVAADCVAFAAPDFHQRLADGKVMLIGCPKFEEGEALAHKLEAIVRVAKPESLLVARMEVPCCRALTKACLDALCAAGEDIPQREAVISRAGEMTGS